MTPIRLLIVDDSRSMRMQIAAALAGDRDIAVVGEAADPIEAREAIKVLNPDVVTLDVEMPRMNGLDFLERLMRLRPTPVVMVSSLTGSGCDAAVKAMAIGAIDCIAKPEPGAPAPFGDLADKIRSAASVRFTPRLDARDAPKAARASQYRSDGRIVAIGASTGGVEALSAVLAHFPPGCPPTVITQHMPPKFTTSFARRLDNLCGGQVTEAVDGAVLEPGRVYLAPGGAHHLTIAGSAARPTCRLVKADPVNGHRPSVDVLFASVAKVAGPAAVGVVLTGMGGDGARGLAAMRQAGARTIGQNEATSLIYGMPRAAFEAGAVERQLALEAIGPALIAKTTKKTDLVRCP